MFSSRNLPLPTSTSISTSICFFPSYSGRYSVSLYPRFGCDPFRVPDVPDTRANIMLYIRLDPVTHNTCPLPWYVLWCLVFICVFLTPARYFHPSVDIQGNQVSVPILRTWNIDVMWPQNNATEILQQYILTGMQWVRVYVTVRLTVSGVMMT